MDDLDAKFSLHLQSLVEEAMGSEIFKASEQFTEALKPFFTDRQLLLIMRKSIYTNKCFSKTDSEYYSRTVKPRLMALLKLIRFKSILEVMADNI